MRTTALVVLGAWLWRAWMPSPAGEASLRVTRTSDLSATLDLAVRTPVASLELALDSLPGAESRAVARAVAGAGTNVRWSLSPAPSLTASVVEPLAEPSGRVRLTTLGRPGASMTARDAAGAVDSAKLSETGLRAVDATLDGAVRVHAPGVAASAAHRDSLLLRPVLVLGRAGWEGKFIVAALEEAGWRVEARLSVAPLVDVRQGTGDAIDTARYSAIVLLDASAASRAVSVSRFVRSGGGVIVAGDAARAAAFSSFLPARAGDAIPATLGAFASDSPRRALGGIALTGIAPSAVVIERSGRSARIVGSRVDAGRVVMLGYDETWRWRMEGDDISPAAHRAWWSSLVSSVAYAPRVQLTDAPLVDEAPFASMVEALGPPMALASVGASPVTGTAWDRILFAIVLLALLAEWTSRRLRGAR